MKGTRVLLVDDDAEMLEMLRQRLASDGFEVSAARGGVEGISAIEREDVDVVLTDLVMDGADGMAVLAATRRLRPAARVLVMTAFGSLETAIEALRQGAYDYLTKPFKLTEMTVAVERALEDRRLRRENERLRAHVEREDGIGRILGRSARLRRVLEQIQAVAGSDAPVLLLGESGTGKELAARAIHWAGPRRAEPFVPVNVGAVPETLLETELFGHEKGAFTGADRKRPGLFGAAHRGTLFLDEIGDLSVPLQVKLLRAIQDRAVRPVGSSTEIDVDIRVISATNRDLAALVRDGRFREDLYYRLAVVPIRLPALRERPEDIPLLAEHFLRRASRRLGKELAGFADAALGWMCGHRWPGNVRELENVVERAAVLAQGSTIALSDLGTEFALDAGATSLRPTLDELATQYMRRVLRETGGDKQAAARVLGVSVRTIQRKVVAGDTPGEERPRTRRSPRPG
jgi:two-component system response regulator HydG